MSDLGFFWKSYYIQKKFQINQFALKIIPNPIYHPSAHYPSFCCLSIHPSSLSGKRMHEP